ncbi:transcriptional regulator [Vibrio parahaemolyticus]|uniref:HVO_A0114 family putative DNA-binding protein n=1 Tax=Vibrio parahaemolyticus TaxID=670 RepID=UPI0004D7CF23|nr:transcriptional regulator [Vibrio parahaemolyticus]EGQ7874212.1 transcriptional regulator [Vibrio parahaemolyticus]EGQ8293389.1 transcriptional regulator [Vibrio parahaemolyticus]EGQ8300293.1 transcriptional regulator [Vibrio parahaemolyticus]EGR0226348.1 transcriptional regulator [Vibrio parahaemolyticus]EGR1362659.1 transcriptional regulator [Vibrio parahaemolyticus]
MKARIGIMSEDLIRKHMINVAAGNTTHNKYIPSLWFTSLDEASKLLSNENIELMILMSKEKPENLTELAEISGYNIRKLSRIIHSLSSKGFIQIEKKGNTARPTALFTDFEILLGKELENKLQEGQFA